MVLIKIIILHFQNHHNFILKVINLDPDLMIFILHDITFQELIRSFFSISPVSKFIQNITNYRISSSSTLYIVILGF
jgi:hypothetical protein